MYRTPPVERRSDEWGTPPELVARARAVLGRIHLDPASNPTAQKLVVQATHFYRKGDGALKRSSAPGRPLKSSTGMVCPVVQSPRQPSAYRPSGSLVRSCTKTLAFRSSAVQVPLISRGSWADRLAARRRSTAARS